MPDHPPNDSPISRAGLDAGRPAGRWPRALRRLTATLLVVFPAAVVCARAMPPDAPAAHAVWSTLHVPGGIDAAAAAVGIDRPVEPARAVLEIVRRVYDPPQGSADTTTTLLERLEDHLRRVQDHATTGGEVHGRDEAPLPLDAAFWTRVVLDAPVPDQELFRAIVTNRRAALFYSGLAALDESTLAFLAGHDRLASALARQHAPAFASFGRSLRIRDDRPVLPGGDEAIPLWEHVVGEPTANVEAFVLQLFARSGGRVAYLLDSLTFLDAPRQRFALGLTVGDPVTRQTRFGALLRAVGEASRSWNIDSQPFARPLLDVVPLLQHVLVTPYGTLAPPYGRRFLARVTASFDLPRDPAGELASPGSDQEADAAWLASLLLHPNVEVRQRHRDALLFAQRLFGRRSESEPADVLVAARALGRYRLAMQTLERMDIADASIYALVARTADVLSRLGRGRGVTALAQFQGALAAIERARFGRAIDVTTATRLVETLATLPGASTGHYEGTVADWISGELLPALEQAGAPADADPEGRAEQTLFRAWAGCAAEAPERTPTVDWEGATYQWDRCRTEVARLVQMRRRQRATPLDVALAVHARMKDLQASPASVDGVAQGAGDLAALHTRIVAGTTESPEDLAVGRVADGIARAVASLERIRRPEDLGRVARIVQPLGSVVDLLVADSLASLAYASALGDPDGRLARAPALARRHDFGIGQDVRDARWSTPWQLAAEDRLRGQAVAMRGSLLALDVALARESLWRLSLAPPLRSPRLATVQNAGFAETVVLMNTARLDDEGRDVIGTAMQRGRERLESAMVARALDEVAGRVRLGDWRRGVLPWVAAHQPDRLVELFAPRELFELGLADPEAGDRPSLDGWGAPAQALTGCLCLQFPDDPGWERDTGRPASGTLAARSVDATLVVAAFLFERRLPAVLVRDILAGLMQHLVDEAPALHFDDWFSVMRYVSQVSPEALEDLVASLTARGPLIPLDGAGAARPR